MKKISTELLNEEGEEFCLDGAIGHLFRRAYQRTSSVLIAQISEYDITPVQFATLARLDEYGSVSQNRLGRLVDIEPGNFHGVVNRLLKRNLIQKMKDKGDQRKINLSLTGEGISLLQKLIPMSEAATEKTLEPLTSSQRLQLYKLLHLIIKNK